MKIVINGESKELMPGTTVTDVLVSMGRGRDPRGVAVAVNGAVVHKIEWSKTLLADDDRLEVLTAVGGG